MIETNVERRLKTKARVLGFVLAALMALFLVLAASEPAQGRLPIGNTSEFSAPRSVVAG